MTRRGVGRFCRSPLKTKESPLMRERGHPIQLIGDANIPQETCVGVAELRR